MKFGIRELSFMMLLLAIPFGAYLWMFKPANEHMTQQQQEIETKAQKLASLRKALAGAKDLDKEVVNLKKAVEFFEGKLPEHHEIHRVLQQVTTIVEKQRLETKLFKTLKTKPCAAYFEQPIKMVVYGNFEAYYEFVLALEKLPRITKIVQMKIEKDREQEGMMRAEIELSIFFAKDPA